ncbi:MAG: hypothetical protein OHK0015_53860 [Chloroflexi bacterium OHK40]
MNVRYTLKELRDLAVNETGFCVGVYWRSVTGSCVPEGMVSANCRLAYVLFSGFAPAYRFYDLLTRKQADRLPRHKIRLVEVAHTGQRMVGVAVVAVMSPNRARAEGLERAPDHHRQPGYQRFFQAQALRTSQSPAWWEHELGDTFGDDTPEVQEFQPGREYAERQADEETEHILDRLEAEYDEKLWWYGTPGRRTKYPPALGSVQELFAYARKQELDPEEFARRNRERQSEQWLSEQHARDRSHQQELDADQAEVSAALCTTRRGRRHADDQGWLATEQTLRARKGLKHLYRDAAPRPRRPREA